MQGVCLQFVIVVFPDHTHFLFLTGRYCITPVVGVHMLNVLHNDVMIVFKPHAHLHVRTINKRLTKFQKDRYTV